MTEKEFTITKVSWLTQRKGLNIDRENVIKEHKAFALFLQNNKLTTKILLRDDQVIDDDFSIKSTDLTEEGMELVRKGYEKWLDAQDRGRDPMDVTLLEKTLKKIRRL